MPIITAQNIAPRLPSNQHQSSALTDEDLENRRGCFTGSSDAKLMSKSSKAGSWSAYTPEMICDFGKTAKDLIFQKLMERKTGIVTRMKQTQDMRYGNDHEDDIFEPLKKELQEKEGITLEKCKFIKLPNIMAGATPDGVGLKNKKNVLAVEIKCCLTAGTFRHRVETANTDKNCDYWQHIREMMVLGVDRLVYAIGMPPKSFNDPVPNYEIMEVRFSKIHARALSDRTNLSDKIINDFIANDRKYQDFNQSMLQSISEWRPPEEKVVFVPPEEKSQKKATKWLQKEDIGNICAW